MKQINN